MVYTPSEFVFVSLTLFVALLVAFRVAFGIDAPEGSVTVPVIVARYSCACRVAHRIAIRMAGTAFLIILLPLSKGKAGRKRPGPSLFGALRCVPAASPRLLEIRMIVTPRCDEN